MLFFEKVLITLRQGIANLWKEVQYPLKQTVYHLNQPCMPTCTTVFLPGDWTIRQGILDDESSESTVPSLTTRPHHHYLDEELTQMSLSYNI